MQLQLHTASEGNVIQAAKSGWIKIDDNTIDRSVLVSRSSIHNDWPVNSVQELEESHAHQLIELEPEVVILGTGEQLVFPERAFLTAFLKRGIGCEVMDTLAACRTYNVLIGEGRAVLAALILASADES